MSTADERWCSVCKRWHLRPKGYATGWTVDRDGAWLCPACSLERLT
jgi:hypothetical protein